MSKYFVWVIIIKSILQHHNPQLLRSLRLPRRREFSFFALLVRRETTLKFDGLLSVGRLLLWSISFPSPLWTLPSLSARRRAAFLDARSRLAFLELWNLEYSCRFPSAVLCLPTQSLPISISP